eukprot:NODE_1661_length_1453_cov_24.188746_g1501_i0.p1 GENE.NODE_1661_length_1453_cov_24.188746_g1501_i0~~NODE_1661_length_1453_cov_24.188746_g1501_i0.p1  ORF type:complete len:482 (+),score=57.45 NODE_1661_length_1453_cov_24.188746_g1501_i0:129-1448(+)
MQRGGAAVAPPTSSSTLLTIDAASPAEEDDDLERGVNTSCQKFRTFKEFSVDLCYDQNTCTGHVLLRRVAGPCKDTSTPLSLDPMVARLFRSIGPDWLQVRIISGPMIAPAVVHHLGNCCYNATLPQLTLAGKYTLHADLRVTNYDHVREVPNGVGYFIFPPIDVLPRLQLQCTRSVPSPPEPSLPVCADGAHPGRWLTGQPGCIKGTCWRPFSCRYLRFNAATSQRCLRPMTVAFVGDSQVRTLFDGLRNLLLDRAHPIQKYTDQFLGMDLPQGGKIGYYWDPHVELQPMRAFTNWTHVVFGGGQWMAKENWSYAMYAQWLRNRTSQIHALRRAGSKTVFIWHGFLAAPRKPMVPPWDTPLVYRKPKGQNNAKYSCLNSLAVETMAAANVPMLDPFIVSYPVADNGFNVGSHFVNPARNPVLDTLCQMLLTLLCPADG